MRSAVTFKGRHMFAQIVHVKMRSLVKEDAPFVATCVSDLGVKFVNFVVPIIRCQGSCLRERALELMPAVIIRRRLIMPVFDAAEVKVYGFRTWSPFFLTKKIQSGMHIFSSHCGRVPSYPPGYTASWFHPGEQGLNCPFH